ncbi:hypothetical protein MMC34_006017 [Xylographa carneopallida]|nr:hypothetical protein [Xylographa carneopallida]
MSLLNELYEAISQHPPAIEARKLLIQEFTELGWLDAANGAAQELLEIDPLNDDARVFCLAYKKDTVTPPQSSISEVPSIPADRRIQDDPDVAKVELAEGFKTLRARAIVLQREACILRNLQQQKGISSPCDKHIPDLAALVAGSISTVTRTRPSGSARAVARLMEADPERALDVAIKDLTDMSRWLQSSGRQAVTSDNDTIREALVKRVRALVAALPDKLQRNGSLALMHVEHEVLQRSYICSETMYGDPVSDIQRENFWVSEDGYAWDMNELVLALRSNGGVLRNPLSRQLFTTADIQAILEHPLGSGLAAMQIEQSKLSQGLRSETIEQLETLAAILLADMSDDQVASRQAVDDFLAYVATLPQSEQKAIDELRVPAKDRHTGQPFDTSIGESVRDAQGNRLCFHKTGDLISQSARYLRQR